MFKLFSLILIIVAIFNIQGCKGRRMERWTAVAASPLNPSLSAAAWTRVLNQPRTDEQRGVCTVNRECFTAAAMVSYWLVITLWTVATWRIPLGFHSSIQHKWLLGIIMSRLSSDTSAQKHGAWTRRGRGVAVKVMPRPPGDHRAGGVCVRGAALIVE